MIFRPAISAPLPWLTMAAGRVLGRTPQRGREKARPIPFLFRVTREGWWFIGVLFLIGIAAINTANNLLYLVAATLLSLIIISGILSRSTLRGLGAERSLVAQPVRGEPVIVRLTVSNRKRLLPSFSLVAEEVPTEGLRAAPAYIMKLGPGGLAVTAAEYTFTRRGRFRLTGLRVTTRFPFGLFMKGAVRAAPMEVVVYPALGGQRPLKTGLRAAHYGEAASRQRGHGAELYGLREYTPRDDSRFIHWPSAARTHGLLFKEFEQESAKRAVVVFENRSSGDADAFEDAVEDAAGALARLMDAGFAVGLKTLTDYIAPELGREHLHRMLLYLALAVPAGEGGVPDVRIEEVA